MTISPLELRKLFDEFLQLSAMNHPESHELTNPLLKHYVNYNIDLISEIIKLSNQQLKQLKTVKDANEVFELQAAQAENLNKIIPVNTQNFLNSTLTQIADYNAWLKAHCELTTD